MKKNYKDMFFIQKFNYFILILSLITFLVISLVLYFTTNKIAQKIVQNNVLSQFLEINKNIVSPNTKIIKPITKGIIYENELVVVYRGEVIEFSSPIPEKKENLKEISVLVSKNENDKRAIKLKLYINLKERVRNYYLDMYLVFFTAIFALILFIALMSVKFLRKSTNKLYDLIGDVKDFDKLGLEFNEVKKYKGIDEAAILSNEYNRIVQELRKAYDREREFVDDAAHELRVPLVKIEGSINALDKKGFSEESRNIEKEYIKGCLHEAKTLIDNMLDLTNEKIIVKDKISGTNIAEVTNDVVESYKIIYEDFIFNVELENFSYQIRKADIVKLMNILIDNGIQFSKDSKKQIDIELKQQKEKFVLSIKDYGIGITPENQQRIFDVFWRADSSRARDKGGAGIGLSIAKNICDRYQLKLTVNSIVDQGTTVNIEFV
jgi:signal transduction histidine kinase